MAHSSSPTIMLRAWLRKRYKSLDEGAKVSYEATQAQKGTQANNVSRV